MNIREAKLDDVPVLADLAANTYADAFGSSLPQDVLADELEQRRSVAYFRWVVNTDTVLVAEQGGRLVGGPAQRSQNKTCRRAKADGERSSHHRPLCAFRLSGARRWQRLDGCRL